MSKYVFKPYNKIFPELFEKEKRRLSKFLTGNYTIEHVGSTAVPNLGGKGIIDIFIATENKNLKRISKDLISAGYKYRPKGSKLVGHLYFRKDLPDVIEKTRRYHVHLNNYDAEDYKEAIIFRDYLRKHKEELIKYADIKKKAIKEGKHDTHSYLEAKNPIIQEILRKALR